MFDAVIFDMDGLLVDSEPVWAASWDTAFARVGLTLDPDFFLQCAGSNHERISRLVDEFYGREERAHQACADHYVIAEQNLIENGASLKPGVIELLDAIAAQGIPGAVASSSHRPVVEAVLGHAGIRERFSAIVTGDMGYASKPAPDIFLAAASELGVSPENSLVLEDSLSGVAAALAGNMPCVMVPDIAHPTDELRARCLAVCDTLLDVIPLL